MRYGGAKKRRDGNEAGIIQALRDRGIAVWQIHVPGFADLITLSRQRGWLPLEVKSARGRLTPLQETVHASASIPTVRNVHEALQVFGLQQGPSPASGEAAEGVKA